MVLHAEDPDLLEEIESNLLEAIENIDLADDFEAFEKTGFKGCLDVKNRDSRD